MSEKTAASAEFDEHQKTYDGFIRFSKISIVAILNILVCLILFTYGGGAGTFFGTILMIATLVAAAIGLFSGDRGWIPSAAVFVLCVLAWIVTAT
ncbi:MAG: aa3-type cytochrome c oxidase subunit IV [Stappiaceae bacterium]